VEIRSPKATRPWQHVLEPLSGYLTFAQCLTKGCVNNGEAFNFGPRAEQSKTVLELVQDLAELWGLDRQLAVGITGNVPFKEATLLKLNCDKALAFLNWQSTLRYEECVRFIADWYKAFYLQKSKHEMFLLTEEQIKEYTNRAKERQIGWTE